MRGVDAGEQPDTLPAWEKVSVFPSSCYIFEKPLGDTENSFGRPASRHASDPFLSSHFFRAIRALASTLVCQPQR